MGGIGREYRLAFAAGLSTQEQKDELLGFSIGRWLSD